MYLHNDWYKKVDAKLIYGSVVMGWAVILVAFAVTSLQELFEDVVVD